MNIIYLNGEYVTKENAKISIMDRGFLFGDGVYEVIPVFDGHMLGLTEHLQRLEKSLNAIELPTPLTQAEWATVLNTLLEKNKQTSATLNLYLQVTRGAEEFRHHDFPNVTKPTIIAFCMPVTPKSRNILSLGFSAITLEDTRRRDCSIKTINLLPNILLYEQAKRTGSIEAILIRDGFALEGTSSNLFIVTNNELWTPPLSDHILHGVTRQLIINLAHDNKIPCWEKNISTSLLQKADEIWVTGSSKEICPIVQLNDKPVGTGKTGPLWHRMMKLYEQHKQSIQKQKIYGTL